MKKITFLLVLAIVSFNMKSQSGTTTKQKMQQSKSLTTKSEPVISKYGSLESDILAKLISKEIPGNFPIYDSKKENIEKYKTSINSWAKENSVYVKPEYRTSFFDPSTNNSK